LWRNTTTAHVEVRFAKARIGDCLREGVPLRWAFVVGVALVLTAGRVEAQPRSPPADAPIAEYPQDPARARSVAPNPDAARGLVEEPDDPEDAALDVPRALLFVPANILEVVFTPLRWAGHAIDEYRIREHVIDFLYNDERTAAFYPIVLYEPSYGPSVGIGAFHTDVFGHEEHASGRAQFLGRYEQSYRALFAADHFLGAPIWLESRLHYDAEPQVLFAGLQQPEDPVRSRFSQERVFSLNRVGVTIGERPRMAKVGVSAKYNHRLAEGADDDFDDPPIQDVYDTSSLVGFGRRWDTIELDANLVIDTRNTRGFTSSGVLFESFGGGVMPNDDHGTYGHYGAEGSLFIDLYLHRVLTLRLGTEGVVGDERDIHFAELPQLGGSTSLRGYTRGLFRGNKSVLGTVQYNWPVHTYVSAELFADVGKVGRDYEAIFADTPKEWRPGIGGGFQIHSDEDTFLRFDLAWGVDQGVGVYFSTGPLQDLDERSLDL
jgi:surface antigen Omp85-like protein